jgi:hypothetical protein
MQTYTRFFPIIIFAFTVFNAHAGTRIAVLDFELKDLTLAPGVPEEIQRTALIKPLLENQLKQAGYEIVTIDSEVQQRADSGRGYLFDHIETAASLGEDVGADYVIIGRLHKPSFLFAYLMARLVKVQTGHVIGDYISEVKGSQKKLTIKGVESLTVKIDSTLSLIGK